jgi:hypothetical protein
LTVFQAKNFLFSLSLFSKKKIEYKKISKSIQAAFCDLQQLKPEEFSASMQQQKWEQIIAMKINAR